jgi:hypothetical protein
MATAYRPQILTPLSDAVGGTIPGDAATGHVMRSIDEWFRAIEPRRTELINMAKTGSPGDQMKDEWAQRKHRSLNFKLEGSHSSGTTTITFESGQGARAQQYMVLKIFDNTNGDELVWLSGDMPVSGDAITGVVRGVGGTSAVTHPDASVVFCVGTALPYAVDHVLSPVQFGDFFYNYYQRFAGSIAADKADLVTGTWEDMDGRKMADMIRTEASNQKYLLQRAMIHGGRQAPNNTTAPRTPGMLGAIPTFLSTNVEDLHGMPISHYDLDDIAAQAWQGGSGSNTTDGSDEVANVLLMSMKMKRALARKLMPLRELTQGQQLDFRLKNFYLDSVGEVTPIVIHDFPEDEIWGIVKDGIELASYKTLSWHFNDLPTAGEYEWEAFTGDWTLRVKGEQRMFRLYNIATNLDLYPKASY